MPIDWIYGLVGGLLIGFAGAVLLLGNGRIMGASGITGSLVDQNSGAATSERGIQPLPSLWAGQLFRSQLLGGWYRVVLLLLEGHSLSHRNTAWTTNLSLGLFCSELDGGLSVCAQGQQSHR